MALILLSDWQKSQVEFWRKTEFEGYDVSSFGRVRSYWTRKIGHGAKHLWEIGAQPKILNQQPSWQGYLRVYLRVNGVRRCFFSHRVVAKAFIANTARLPEVNHKTTLNSDNRVDNLEWQTRSGNASHAKASGVLSTKRKGYVKLTADAVRDVRRH